MALFINDVAINQFSVVRKHFNEGFLTCQEIRTLASRCGLRVLEDTVNKPREYEIIVGDCERDGVKKFDDRDALRSALRVKRYF